MPIMIIIDDVPSQKVWSLVKQADRTGVKDYRYHPEGLTQQCWEGVQHPNSHRHTSHVSAFSSSSPSTSPSSGTSQVWRPRLSFRGKSPAATHVIITSSTSTNPQNSRQQSLVHDCKLFYNTSLKSCEDTGEVTLRLKHPTHSRKGAFLEHPKSLLQGDLSQLLGVLFLHCQISRMGNGVAQRGMHILL